ncbi:MAG: acetate--CoA ligase [Sandaracinaceae bacterium]|nr:acetate--CoA ligase [Sandaracinaceae bacterium]
MTEHDVLAEAGLDGLPGGGLNIAYEALDRHATDRVALRWLAKAGGREDVTYAELRRRSARFANAMASLGLSPGDAVFVLSGRVPELYVTALGALRAQLVFCPLFAAFGPEPIRVRLAEGRGRVLVTTQRQYERKVAALRSSLPDLAHVILIDGEAEGCLGWSALVGAASDAHTIAPTDPETPALLHFTSGTTGAPKGALHVHGAVVHHHQSARHALDLRPGDTYWCTADPGWVTGTSYGIIAPLTVGVTMIVDEAEMDVERWYTILEEERVEVWYTSPTAIRVLIRAGEALARRRDLSRLRFAASVGEPLDPESVVWGERALGRPFHDNWWQTETGGIMIANVPGAPIKPGSMGKPLPGVEAAIVEERGGALVEVTAPGVEGELALRPGWPSMMRAYLNAPERYAKCFRDGWYLSGDRAKRDADGYFWFVGRADDIIKSAGHLIGPFEVESALVEHAAVAEAAAIGKPDAVAGEIVKAFVVLHQGVERSAALDRDLMAHARRRLGPAVAPREIAIVEELPKTRSGKVLRRLLRARELGLPEGDTSTLLTSKGDEP